VNSKSRLAAFVAAIAVLALGLTACGDDDDGVGGAEEKEAVTAKAGPVEGNITISNWPGYIDPGPNGTVKEFEDRYGEPADV
jgi:spermidine/putrescine-binding protein